MSLKIEEQFLKLVQDVWLELFETEADFSLEEFRGRYAADIPLVSQQKCQVTGQAVHLQRPAPKVISRSELEKDIENENLFFKSEAIDSMEELLEKFDRINYFTGDYVENSTHVYKSDQVFSCSNIFQSSSVFTSKNLAFCNGVWDSEMSFACKDNRQLSYCIRAFESKALTNCFEIHNAGKCSNCMFIHDAYDLRDCLFCFHIRSAQYCVANMQYSRDEYYRLRALVVNWLMQGGTIGW